MVGADFVHIDGAVNPVSVGSATSARRLIRVVNNTKGLSLNIRSGSRVIGNIATTSAEGAYMYGVYCENGIQVDVSGTGDATLVFSNQ